MMALTLWEPWASAMALGLKLNETRGWATQVRGRLAIHAAKRPMTVEEWDTFEILINPGNDYETPYGCVVCVVDLYDCVPTRIYHPPYNNPIGAREAALGDYTQGRFAWLTRDCVRLKQPIPARGGQGFWKLPPEVVTQIRPQLPAACEVEHHCHATGCTVPVAPKLLMCAGHWRMVPKALQRAVWRWYRAGQEQDKNPSSAYLAAAKAAIDAVATQEGKKCPGAAGPSRARTTGIRARPAPR